MINITKALPHHKDYILFANRKIHDISEQQAQTRLDKHIDQDLFGKNPKCECIVAELDKIPVGMCLYSKMYWADDGEVLWVSQIFVNPKNRKDGIFFNLIDALKKFNPESKIVACATAKSNTTMRKILEYKGLKEIDMVFYAKSLP